MYLLHIIAIKDVIPLDNHDKIDCVDAIKKYTKQYLWDDSQHVFTEVQSQCEYTVSCAFNHYMKSKVTWIKCDQVICYVDCSICLTDIKQWMQTMITHGQELLLTWLVFQKTLFLTTHLLKLFEDNLFWMTNNDSFTIFEGNQLCNNYVWVMKWASSSAVGEKCLRVIHDSDNSACSVSKSFAQLLSLLWLSLTHIVTHSIDCVWWFTSQIFQVALYPDAHHCWLVCSHYWAYLPQKHQHVHHNVKFLHHQWSTFHADRI